MGGDGAVLPQGNRFKGFENGEVRTQETAVVPMCVHSAEGGFLWESCELIGIS
jgi:hypothetical protein